MCKSPFPDPLKEKECELTSQKNYQIFYFLCNNSSRSVVYRVKGQESQNKYENQERGIKP